jgi:prepilin-type N-terminal cleavage/methylation domain-containing protein
MKNQPETPAIRKGRRGFTLMETVIAIGVIALLLTGFVAVFAPAVDGIRKSINVQDADRLASTLERELATLRPGQGGASINTGFDKAFEWIKNSNQAEQALVIYQYRGNISTQREDGTPAAVSNPRGTPGRDYVVVPMLRRLSDSRLTEDLQALEGQVFVVRCIQLVYNNNGELEKGTPGQIADPRASGGNAGSADQYPEAVIAFAAEFYSLPSRDATYLRGEAFKSYFNDRMRNPMFTRNLAVRR